MVIKFKDLVFCISNSFVIATASSIQQHSRNVCGASILLDKGVVLVLSPLRDKEHGSWSLLSASDDEHYASASVISCASKFF